MTTDTQARMAAELLAAAERGDLATTLAGLVRDGRVPGWDVRSVGSLVLLHALVVREPHLTPKQFPDVVERAMNLTRLWAAAKEGKGE